MITLLGWIGSLCFAAAGIPQGCQCIRQGHANGVSLLMLILWLIGEVCYVVAVLAEFGWVWWLLANYLTNLVVISVILAYKVRK